MNSPLVELAARKRAERPWLFDEDPRRRLFQKQRDPLLAGGKRKALRCSRRSGKTMTGRCALADGLQQAGFDEAIAYAAKTRQIAKRLMWGKLHELAHAYRMPWKFHESELSVSNERGGFIMLAGLDKPAEIEKLRGLKIRRFVGDEPETYAELIGDLLDEVVEPACTDVDGDIWLIGTPGRVRKGVWHDASTGTAEDWSVWHWTMFDNPYLADPRGFVERVMKRKGWTWETPNVIREYLGEWCDDDDAQVYRYLASRNDCAWPVDYDRDAWVHTVGFDFGVNDAFAVAALGSEPHSQRAVFLEADKRSGLLFDQMALWLLRYVLAYRPATIVGDPGGGGKTLIDQWNARYAHGDVERIVRNVPSDVLTTDWMREVLDDVRQLVANGARCHGIAAVAAEKAEKRAHIDLMNTELRTARLLTVKEKCRKLCAEWSVLPWKEEKHEQQRREHPAYANDLADAALYVFRHHYAYLHQPAPQDPMTLPLDSPTRIDAEIAEHMASRRRTWWNK